MSGTCGPASFPRSSEFTPVAERADPRQGLRICQTRPRHIGRDPCIKTHSLNRIVEVLRRAGIAEVEIDAKMIGGGPVGLCEKFGFRAAGTVSLDDESEDVYFHTMTLKLADRKDQPPEPSCSSTCPCPGTSLEDDGGPAAASPQEDLAPGERFSSKRPSAAR